jgi:putative ABC transport system permease protein
MRFLRDFPEFLRMAMQALRANLLRSVLTTLGIVIGIATIIAIFTIIQGMNRYVYENLSIISASTVYVQKFPWVIQGDFWRYRNRPDISDKQYDDIRAKSKIADYVAPFTQSIRTAKFGNTVIDNLNMLGTNEHYLYTSGDAVQLGRFIQPGDVMSSQRVTVLGWDIAEDLFINANIALGKEIKIGGVPFRVVGVQEKRGMVFGQSADDYVYIPYTTMRSYFGAFPNFNIAVKVNDVAQLPDLIDELQGILRLSRRLEPTEEDDFSINKADMLTDFYNQVTGPLFLIAIIIGSVSLLVGGIGIMNIMLVSVIERTREIGVRKAIGASRSNVMIQFISEAVLISLVGGVLGLGLGLFIASLVASGLGIDVPVTAVTMTLAVGFASLVGIFSGFYPAWKAAGKDPIEALRYE